MPRFARQAVFLLLALLILSACVEAAPPPGSASPAAASGTPAAETPAAEGGGAVTIGFAAPEFERQAYEPLIAEFNKQNADVQVRFIPYSEILGSGGAIDGSTMTQRLVTAADTAEAPAPLSEDVAAGLLRDLEPLIESDPSFDRDDYLPGALGQPGQSGVFALPRTLAVVLLNYNKELWVARGLAAPKPDWTWADLLAAAQQLARKSGDTVETYGLLGFDAAGMALAGTLESSGAAARLTDTATPQLDDPDVAAAVQRVADMVKSGAIYRPEQSGTFNPDELQKLIDGQRAGMWAAGQVRRVRIGNGAEAQPAPAKPFTTGVAPLPPLPYRDTGGGLSYVMSGGTQHPDAAWRWLSFLSKQNVASPFSGDDSPGEVPARKSIAESSGYWARLDPEAKAAVETALAHAAAASKPAPVPQLRDALEQALDAVVGGTPAKRALAEAQATLSQQLAQAQLTPTATPQGPVVVATPAPDVAPPGAAPIAFSGFGMGGDLRQLAREFNQAHPDLFVQVKDPDFGKPPSFASVAATSDCFAWFGAPAQSELTATLDLQPLFDSDPAFKLGDYPELLLAPFRRDGKLYGLPDQVNLRTLTYNKAAFEAAGLEPPQAGWTVEQFLQAAQKLTNDDDKDKRYGFASIGSSAEDLRFFARMYGASLTRGSGDALAPNFTDPQVLQAVRAYVDLLKHDSPHQRLTGYTRDMAIGDALPLVSEGRVGMWFDYGGGGVGAVFIRVGGDRAKATEQAIAPPPFGKGAATPDDVRSTGLYISADTQQAAGCWEWLKYLSSALGRFTTTFPARTSVAASQAFLGQAKPGAAEVYAAYRELLKQASAPAPAADIDYFWFSRAADQALQGENLDHTMAEAQTLTEQHLACVRSGGKPAECAKQVDPTYDGVGTRN